MDLRELSDEEQQIIRSLLERRFGINPNNVDMSRARYLDYDDTDVLQDAVLMPCMVTEETSHILDDDGNVAETETQDYYHLYWIPHFQAFRTNGRHWDAEGNEHQGAPLDDFPVHRVFRLGNSNDIEEIRALI